MSLLLSVSREPVVRCRGPASAGSRATLRMNGVGETETQRQRERPDWGCAAESGKSLFFTVAFIF